MQPYFVPYIGYFQLIYNSDVFVVYDNIKYTKKGWINRNRILVNGNTKIITIPIKKDSDYLNINQRKISNAFDKSALLNQILSAYKKAPFYNKVIQVIEKVVMNDEDNLFNYIYDSIIVLCDFMKIDTRLIKSSDLDYNNNLKAQNKVIDICKVLNTINYINSIGGKELYEKKIFHENGINLMFLKTLLRPYYQYKSSFVPGLSIIDILMNNSVDEIRGMLTDCIFE